MLLCLGLHNKSSWSYRTDATQQHYVPVTANVYPARFHVQAASPLSVIPTHVSHSSCRIRAVSRKDNRGRHPTDQVQRRRAYPSGLPARNVSPTIICAASAVHLPRCYGLNAVSLKFICEVLITLNGMVFGGGNTTRDAFCPGHVKTWQEGGRHKSPDQLAPWLGLPLQTVSVKATRSTVFLLQHP